MSSLMKAITGMKDKNFEFIETQFGKGGRIYFPIDKCFYVINGSKKNGVWYFKCSSGKNGCCKITGKLIGSIFENNATVLCISQLATKVTRVLRCCR
ncbi:hypothetical protein PVAND_007507 [Polypedilum vanderplanki]|uniref:Uncharacterized protein n=1 Tax=Polypedilum vanderplanki TaxID=319348 RepID=A0A9J6C7E5_POLVA|nr:hypothetical protein PVAND_007507 [Polypedilum vanderplanki]